MDVQPPVSFKDTSIAFSSKSDRALRRASRLFAIMNYPRVVNLGTNFIKLALYLRLPVKSLIRETIFKQFCGGETIEDCRPTSLKLNSFGIDTILDYSVEGTEEEEDFEHNTRETLNTIEKSAVPPENPFCVFKVSGIASNKMLKDRQNGHTLNARSQESFEKLQQRVDRICKKAHENGIRVLIDAEESWIQQPIDQLAYQMMEKYNGERPVVFNTYQMYRKDMNTNLREAFHQAVANNYYLGVKLVRGAYMEKERERAEEKGYESPIHLNKKATDDDFNKALTFCIDNIQRIALCCGSHNEYSNYYLTVLMQKYHLKPDDPRVYFSQLYGMSDNISFNLAHAGYNVAKYLPYGPVDKVLPYLIRRAEENTAIAGQTNQEYALIKSELARRKRQGSHS